MVVVLQALLDRHAMLRLRADDDDAGGWSFEVPDAGSVDAGACLHTVDVLTDDGVGGRPVAVEPRRRRRCSARCGSPAPASWR